MTPRRSNPRVWLAALLVPAALAGPALADYKAGADAYDKGDFARALAQWEEAAKQGDSDSYAALGKMWERGDGVEQDYKRAMTHYEKAALKGHAAAQYRMAVLTLMPADSGGRGDPVTAYMWAELARADSGSTGAQAADLINGLKSKLSTVQQADALRKAQAWKTAREEESKPKPEPKPEAKPDQPPVTAGGGMPTGGASNPYAPPTPYPQQPYPYAPPNPYGQAPYGQAPYGAAPYGTPYAPPAYPQPAPPTPPAQGWAPGLPGGMQPGTPLPGFPGQPQPVRPQGSLPAAMPPGMVGMAGASGVAAMAPVPTMAGAGALPPPVAMAATPSATDLVTVQAQLGRFPCSALKVKPGTGGRVVVTGTVSRVGDRDGAQALVAQLLPGQALVLDVAVVGPPLCEALSALAALRDRNDAAGSRLVIRTEKADGRLREGENLVVRIEGGEAASHVQVLYFSLDGQVLRLLPNADDGDDRLPARGKWTIGKPGESRRQWTIGPPFGQEMLAVIASPRPMLYGSARPEAEPASVFLTALNAALESETGAQRSMAAVAFISTQARQ